MLHDDDRLAVRAWIENWARWAVQGVSGSVGWSRVNLLARQGGRSTATSDHVPVQSLDAERMDALIGRMRIELPVPWCVLMCCSIGDPRLPQRRRRSMSTRDIARELCMSTTTVRVRMLEAEEWLWSARRIDRRS